MECKALDFQFPLILPNSSPPCCCAQCEQRQGFAGYTQAQSIQDLQPNSFLYQNAFSGNIIFFFLELFWLVLR